MGRVFASSELSLCFPDRVLGGPACDLWLTHEWRANNSQFSFYLELIVDQQALPAFEKDKKPWYRFHVNDGAL